MNISTLLSRLFTASFTQPMPDRSQTDAVHDFGRQDDSVADFRTNVWHPNLFADQAGLLLIGAPTLF